MFRRIPVLALAVLIGAGLLAARWLREPVPPDAVGTPAQEPSTLDQGKRRATGSTEITRPIYSTSVKQVGAKAAWLTGSLAPPGGEATAILRSHKRAAMAGDSHAALLVYLKLRDCLRAASEYHDDDAALRDAVTLGSVDEAIARQESQARDCKDVTPAQYAERGAWLERSAEQGNVMAQLLYASDPEATVGSPPMMLRNPERLVAYKSKAMTYLQRAARQGSLNALAQLSRAYMHGILVPADPVLAHAYQQAVTRADPSSPPDPDIAKTGRVFSDQQRSASDELARRIYRDCCQAP